MKLISIIFIGFFLTAINFAHGYTANYETMEIVFTKKPFVCILEPNYHQDHLLTENHVDSIMRDTVASLQEWENLLKVHEIYREQKEKWDIEYQKIALDKQDVYDYNKCNVYIHFKPEAPTKELQQVHAIGLANFKENENGRFAIIDIYYKQFSRCESHRDANYIYYKFCYKDDIILSSQLANTVKHEFGHVLGLGHYLADDPTVNQAWAKPNVPHPSIMAIYRPDNPDERKISQLDIDTIRKIYGVNGFVIKIIEPENEAIPLWIRNNAGWWYSDQISDDDFIKGIEYLISKNIITSQKSGEGVKSVQQIPAWVKNNAGWWSQGLISDNDFLNGVNWLVNKGMIKISKV